MHDQDDTRDELLEEVARLRRQAGEPKAADAERKRAEEGSQESERMWRLSIQNVPDIIVTVGRDGSILAINRTVTGRTVEEVIGKNIRDHVPAEHREMMMKAVERVFQTGRPDAREALGTGARGPGTAWYETRVVPIESNGEVIAVTLIVRDVTDRKLAAEALQRSEALWKTLIATAPDAVTVTDLEGRITFASGRTAELHGFASPDELIGKDAFELIAPEDHERALAYLQRTVSEGAVRNLEYVLVRKDGTRFLGELNASLIKDERGNPKALVATTRDITERKRAQEEKARLEERLRRALEEERDALAEEVSALRTEVQGRYRLDNIIGQDPKMHALFETILTVSRTHASVLIQGETGTGKELVARAIHCNSPRKDRPFVKVDCGVLAGNLLESELFGHERGAYTGAIRDRPGRFELADGGTIFLDEIDNLPVGLQGKLLRVIQDGTFERVGSSDTRKVDVRILSATNEDLEVLVNRDLFRKDLYYRLNVVCIRLPALRERIGDIPLLAESFVRKFAERHQRDVEGMTRAALEQLMYYDWPGNVRELENVIEQAMVLCKGRTIRPDDIRFPKRFSGPNLVPAEGSLRKATEEMERLMLERAMSRSGGNKRRAAELLGVSRSALYQKLEKHGLSARRAPASPA